MTEQTEQHDRATRQSNMTEQLTEQSNRILQQLRRGVIFANHSPELHPLPIVYFQFPSYGDPWILHIIVIGSGILCLFLSKGKRHLMSRKNMSHQIGINGAMGTIMQDNRGELNC